MIMALSGDVGPFEANGVHDVRSVALPGAIQASQCALASTGQSDDADELLAGQVAVFPVEQADDRLDPGENLLLAGL